ncbi:hypothetical protein [Streptomyces sp. NPDC001508]|uniref:hypothetical protein n=1 Tax=Streptomyces sp. NPDC001508 TaxID=3154656 RepID=UPI00332570E4
MATGLREVTDVTPWLRSTFRLLRLLLVLAAVLVPCGTATAYAPEATSPDTPGPSASAEASRAGGRPGRHDGPAAHTEGVDDRDDAEHEPEHEADREHGAGDDGDDGTSPDSGRRGRHHDGHDGHDDRDDAYDDAAPTASESTQQAGLAPSATPPTADAAHGRANASEPTLRLLPLGSGLVLIGLGLALAFVALRLRRT